MSLHSSEPSGSMVKMSTTSLGPPKSAWPSRDGLKEGLTQTCRGRYFLGQLFHDVGNRRPRLLQPDEGSESGIRKLRGRDRRKVSEMFRGPEEQGTDGSIEVAED